MFCLYGMGIAKLGEGFSNKLIAVLGHSRNLLCWHNVIFVLVRPKHHCQHDWRQVKPLWGRSVVHDPSIFVTPAGSDQAIGRHFLQPIGKDVGGHTFVTAAEFFKGAESLE